MILACGKNGGGKANHERIGQMWRVTGRPQRRWRDEVKKLLRGLIEREGMVLARDRKAWDRTVYRLE